MKERETLPVSKKNPHAGHRLRLKARFLKEGLEGFEEHQILELLLFYVVPQKDTNELAHILLERFGSIARVMDAPLKELMMVPGIGEHAASLFKLIPQISSVYEESRFENMQELSTTRVAAEYIRRLFIGKDYEQMVLVCLDKQLRVLGAPILHHGTVDEITVYPRLVVETAISNHAVSVILAHNHPGGSLKPSSSDMRVTRKLMRALDGVGIEMLDHVIVAGKEYFSFLQRGILPKEKKDEEDEMPEKKTLTNKGK